MILLVNREPLGQERVNFCFGNSQLRISLIKTFWVYVSFELKYQMPSANRLLEILQRIDHFTDVRLVAWHFNEN